MENFGEQWIQLVVGQFEISFSLTKLSLVPYSLYTNPLNNSKIN